MAWRVCIVDRCTKTKQIQPFNTNTKHRWLCPKHRLEMQEKTLTENLINVKKSFAQIMNKRESLE